MCRVDLLVPTVRNSGFHLLEPEGSVQTLNGKGKGKGKGKAVPLQDWTGPEGSRKLRFPDFMTTVQDGGKIDSLTDRPPLPQGNTPGTHFR